ncbi:tyrosine-type recombinase/integrase [Peptococcaceae bacterium 1198_IL3148]
MSNSDILERYTREKLRGKSVATIKTYLYVLRQFESWLIDAGADLNTYARSDVQQYLDSLSARGKTASTTNKIYHAIKSFSRWAKKYDAVEDIQLTKQKKKDAPKSLPKKERLKLVREADRSHNLRNYAMIIVLLYTGIRVSELTALNKSDIIIGPRSGTLKVRHGKGDKERELPLGPEVRRAIKKYLEQRTDDIEALFISNRDQRISVRSVQRVLKKYGTHPHALRHTFITGLVRSGKDLSLVQSLSGHSSADMVLRYSQPTQEDKEAAIESLYIDKQ